MYNNIYNQWWNSSMVTQYEYLSVFPLRTPLQQTRRPCILDQLSPLVFPAVMQNPAPGSATVAFLFKSLVIFYFSSDKSTTKNIIVNRIGNASFGQLRCVDLVNFSLHILVFHWHQDNICRLNSLLLAYMNQWTLSFVLWIGIIVIIEMLQQVIYHH